MTEWSWLEAALSDPESPRTPAEFLAADRRALNEPGLYSWWVDEAGARDLSAGLGAPVAAGLVYLGQAGATSWPSGRRYSSTQWSRIAGNHLRGRARSSTLRRTLAAALRDPLDLADPDDPRLDEWIWRHLRVNAVPTADRDELERLESVMIDALDPPLNLSGPSGTPARARLRELRLPGQGADGEADPVARGREAAGRTPAGRGTYRESDGARVTFEVAVPAWAKAARDVLLATAGHYHETISYLELADGVQGMSGIRTGMQMRHWIGDVLGRVTEECGSRQEPLLSALCVRKDGTVGDGYAKAVEAVRGRRPDDPDQHAAEERLACHRFFGAALPSDGGRPALTPRIATRRARQRREQAPKPAVCPTCNTQLPLNGRCDTCD